MNDDDEKQDTQDTQGDSESSGSSKFGTNTPKFDDGKVKYFSSKKAFYLMSKVSDREYLFMALTFNNELLIGYSAQPQPMTYFTNPLYTRKLYLRKALSLFQQQLGEGLELLFRAAKARIKSVTLTADSDRSFMLFKVLLYQGKLKTKLASMGYRIRWEAGDDGEKLVIITRGGQGNPQEKK